MFSLFWDTLYMYLYLYVHMELSPKIENYWTAYPYYISLLLSTVRDENWNQSNEKCQYKMQHYDVTHVWYCVCSVCACVFWVHS